MASIREQIVDVIVQKLDEAGKPSGLTVHRYRTRPIHRDALPAMVVYLLRDPKDQTIRGAVPEAQRTLRVGVECRVEGEPIDTQLDPLYVWAVRQLREDPTLGGLARDLQEAGTEWDAGELDKAYGAAAAVFEITYRTHLNDPEAQL